MKGIIQQIEESSKYTLMDNITEDSIKDFLKDITFGKHNGPLHIWTGVGGFLKFSFAYYSITKLPRKLKKRVYLTAELRRKYIPEYYETTKKD